MPSLSRYAFDVTRCMLSPGNITEKLRIASLECAGQVVVDLYAGKYYVRPKRGDGSSSEGT